ncbi:MAG: hypothetical protein AAFV87_10680 [Pseudomonadota bacterium]
MAHTDLSSAGFRRRAIRPSLLSMIALWRSRRALERLDATALRDIGLEREAAEKEAKRPIWDVPANWRV